jgi:predicted Kef-type K+ transport protein
VNAGILRFTLRMPESGSLKDKRQVVRSTAQRIRNKFQVSVAEVGDNDAWQIATLGVACVTNTHRHCEEMLDEIVALFAALKATAFVGGVLLIGSRAVPFVLERVIDDRSRELFVLAIAALALGTALASEYAGLSLALGAFVAGLVISESAMSQRVIHDLLPTRDVFAVLFFVAAGMLIRPDVLLDEWLAILAVTAAIIVLKPVVAWVALRAAGLAEE